MSIKVALLFRDWSGLKIYFGTGPSRTRSWLQPPGPTNLYLSWLMTPNKFVAEGKMFTTYKLLTELHFKNPELPLQPLKVELYKKVDMK